MRKFYNANEVAKILGISKQTLIRYEHRKLVPKARRNALNNWREYSEEDVLRLKKIMRRG